MSDKPVKGTKTLTSANTMANAVSFLVDQAIKNTVNTAEVVSIDSAEQTGTDGPAGYAAVTPLVCQTDGFDSAVTTAQEANERADNALAVANAAQTAADNAQDTANNAIDAAANAQSAADAAANAQNTANAAQSATESG